MNHTLADTIAFRKCYDRAVKQKRNCFTYKGIQVLTAYAKYVLEYLEASHEQTRSNIHTIHK